MPLEALLSTRARLHIPALIASHVNGAFVHAVTDHAKLLPTTALWEHLRPDTGKE